MLAATAAITVMSIDVPRQHWWLLRPHTASAAESEGGTLTVHVVDEAGAPLPARVHLRDATGRYLLTAGQSTRQRAVYKGTQPVCGDWFYTDGSFSIEVSAGEAQIDISHGPAYATAHETIAIVAGQSTEKTYKLRRLIDPLAMGWYSADEHLHQMPDAALMLAEDLNLAAVPICGGVDLSYRPSQRAHATARCQSPVGDRTAGRRVGLLPVEPAPAPGDASRERTLAAGGFRHVGSARRVERPPHLVRGAHAAAHRADARGRRHHDRLHARPAADLVLPALRGQRLDRRLWRAGEQLLRRSPTEATRPISGRVWIASGTNGNFGVWYRFLNCGYRLPASAGTDNVGMGVGVWKGYNRVYARLDGSLDGGELAERPQAGQKLRDQPAAAVRDGRRPGSRARSSL